MKLIHVNKVDSTHRYLKDYIKKNGYKHPVCIYTDEQISGIGSRGNSWNGIKGNLFFSFAISKNELPIDLPMQSASIYFSFLLKQLLKEQNSTVWLKWPNDFYIEDKKIGGTITTVTGDIMMCGIGLNLKKVSEDFGYIDISLDIDNLLNDYLENIQKKILWREIFREYVIEFQLSKKFQATVNNQKISLEHAILNDDGSIEINNERVYSLR